MTANEDLLEKRYWKNGDMAKYYRDIDAMILTAEGDWMAKKTSFWKATKENHSLEEFLEIQKDEKDNNKRINEEV